MRRKRRCLLAVLLAGILLFSSVSMQMMAKEELYIVHNKSQMSKGVDSVLTYINTSPRMYEKRTFQGTDFTMQKCQAFADYEGDRRTNQHVQILVENQKMARRNCIVHFFDAWGNELEARRNNLYIVSYEQKIHLIGDCDTIARAYDYSVELYDESNKKPSGEYAVPEMPEEPEQFYYKVVNSAVELYQERESHGITMSGTGLVLEKDEITFEAELINEACDAKEAAIDVSFRDGSGKINRTARYLWSKTSSGGGSGQSEKVVMTMPAGDFFYDTVDWSIQVTPFSSEPYPELVQVLDYVIEEAPLPTCQSEEEYLVRVKEGERESIRNTSPYIYEEHELYGWKFEFTDCTYSEENSQIHFSCRLQYQGEEVPVRVEPYEFQILFFNHKGERVGGCLRILPESFSAGEDGISYVDAAVEMVGSTNSGYANGLNSAQLYSYQLRWTYISKEIYDNIIMYQTPSASPIKESPAKETSEPSKETARVSEPPKESARASELPKETVETADKQEKAVVVSEVPEKTIAASEPPKESAEAAEQTGERPSMEASELVKKSEAVSETTSQPAEKSLNLSASVSVKGDGTVKLKWKLYTSVSLYKIYRSVKKNSGYRLKKSVKPTHHTYVDRSVRRGKTYYYKIVPVCESEDRVRKESHVLKVKIPYLTQPKITVKRGKTGEKNYIQIALGRYEGSYAEIYVKKDKGYRKLSVRKMTIAAYHGKYRFLYRKKGILLSFKLRTYQVVDGKKHVSVWSDVKKIKT